MSRHRIILYLVLAAVVAGPLDISAQQSFKERFLAHNTSMTAWQPAMITPLVAPDPRLVQYVKLSFSNEYTSSGTQTVSYGNARGLGIVEGNRFEIDYIPPSYIQHNSAAVDGFGDTSTLVKYRIASGNAERGNFEVTAMLSHCFATGSHKNGAATDSYGPAMVAGYNFKKRYDVISSLGSTLPMGKIAAQGRTIARGTHSCRRTPHDRCGSRWRTMQRSTTPEATTERCRTLLRLELSTSFVARSGRLRIRSSFSTAGCKSRLQASTPTTTI